MLVLDEADRILDMGFAGTLNAILAQLSKERQTMLFSATQTRSVQDLARLSMSDPEFLAVHAESAAATPARLQQTAMIVPLDEKLNMLWSFIKTHLHNKTLVFLSSCKQVSCLFSFYYQFRVLIWLDSGGLGVTLSQLRCRRALTGNLQSTIHLQDYWLFSPFYIVSCTFGYDIPYCWMLFHVNY